jgi:hypothetical protein
VTNLSVQDANASQVILLYRKRADAENVFDELKNQWGFSGFCSQKAVVSETAARMLLLTYIIYGVCLSGCLPKMASMPRRSPVEISFY